MVYLVHMCGWAGTFLIVLAYYLVSNNKINADSVTYQWVNLIGALAIVVHVLYQKAWSAVTLEIIWAVIAIGALVRVKKKMEKPRHGGTRSNL